MRVHRLSGPRWADSAFEGEGARLNGSRWVPRGHAAVYTSDSVSLAVLEMLSHMQVKHIQHLFVRFEVDIPDELIREEVVLPDLPKDWVRRQNDPYLQNVGVDWLRRGESLALVVPSAIVPMQSNVLINPHHPDFVQIHIGEPTPFEMDPRLV